MFIEVLTNQLSFYRVNWPTHVFTECMDEKTSLHNELTALVYRMNGPTHSFIEWMKLQTCVEA